MAVIVDHILLVLEMIDLEKSCSCFAYLCLSFAAFSRAATYIFGKRKNKQQSCISWLVLEMIDLEMSCSCFAYLAPALTGK